MAARKKPYDFRYVGDEPTVTENSTPYDYIKVFNWANYNFDPKDIQHYVHEYVSNKYTKKQQKLIKQTMFPLAICMIARMINLGQPVQKLYTDKLLMVISTALSNNINVAVDESPKKTNIVDIQQHMQNAATKLIEVIDIAIDQREYKFDTYKFLIESQTNQRIVTFVKKYFENELQFLNEEDALELHSTMNSKQFQKLKALYESIVNDCAVFISNKKNTKRRIPKQKKNTIDKQLSKVKYLKNFPDLNLTSVNPSLVIGSKTLWVYNTKTACVTVFHAADGDGLQIKGTTITNFDEKTSISKKVRKPSEQISQYVTGSKSIVMKLVNLLKTKPKVVKGRLNNDVVLLRVVK